MDNARIQTIPPQQCMFCGNKKFHKTEKKMQYYQALMDGEIVFVEVLRRRYRCSECGCKKWDEVLGACSYKKKTDILVSWEKTHEKVEGPSYKKEKVT